VNGVNSREVTAAIRSFNRFYTPLVGVLDRHILHSDFSLTEVRVLYEVFHGEDMTARRIGKTLAVDEGYLSRTVDRLVRAGLIARRRSSSDHRLVSLTLTPRGRSVFLRLDGEADEAVLAMMRHLSADEVGEVAGCMGRIQRLLAREGRIS
jgi:DNA-binding MarR family transcriptional regulator